MLLSTLPAFASDPALQGQSQGSDTWKDGSLDGYKELDLILCRVDFGDGPASNQVITLQFDHSVGVIPGIQDLLQFTPSDNAVITSGPTLDAPRGQDGWSYQFTVNVTNKDHGYVKFHARLAAGSHLVDPDSLNIRGSGSLGTLKIERPDEASGTPDLTVVKTGPATAAWGQTITYTLTYSNKEEAENDGDGVQLSDILPSGVTYVPGSATRGGVLVGNTLTWDLGDLEEGESGTVSYQVRLNPETLPGQSFTNFAQIYSSEDDDDYSDNASSVTTLVLNRPPVAQDDAYQVDEDAILSVPPAAGVMANDTDADGDSLAATVVTGPAHGLLSFSTDGSFSYMPAPDYNGLDSFSYKVSDGWADSGVATVRLTINPVNDAPSALDDAYSVNEDNTLSIVAPGVLANDSDVDRDPLTVVLLNGTAHGTLTLNPNGSFVYVPVANFNGLDTFTYLANDGLTNSASAKVTITVVSVNDAPVARPESYTLNEDNALNVPAPGVLANDTDVDGDRLSAILVAGPAHGSLTLNPDGSFRYLPSPNYNGPDSFTYKANDGHLDSGVVTVSLTVRAVDDAPVANPDRYATDQNKPLVVTAASGVLANDTDVEGDPLEAVLVAGPAHGSVTLGGDGSFRYTSITNYNGADSFTYQANDGVLESAVATVTITIRRINYAPTVSIISPTNGTFYFAPASISIVAEAYDVDGTVTKVEFFRGTNSLTQTNLAAYYAVATNLPVGSYQFTAKATDNDGATAVSSPVSVTVLDHPPSFALQPVHFNPQTGLFEEVVRISNPSQKAIGGVRVTIGNLHAGVLVYNASGKINGIYYVQTILPIQPGGNEDLRIEYYVPDFQAPNPTMTMQLVAPSQPAAPLVGTLVPVTRQLRLTDGTFLVEFNSLSNRIYFVQYSSDMANWKTAWPSITGTGNRVQGVDNGPPRTESMPGSVPCRFYRILMAP